MGGVKENSQDRLSESPRQGYPLKQGVPYDGSMRILTAAGAAIFVAFVAGLLSENWDLVVGAVVATVLWIIVMDRSAKRSGWSKGERP